MDCRSFVGKCKMVLAWLLVVCNKTIMNSQIEIVYNLKQEVSLSLFASLCVFSLSLSVGIIVNYDKSTPLFVHQIIPDFKYRHIHTLKDTQTHEAGGHLPTAWIARSLSLSLSLSLLILKPAKCAYTKKYRMRERGDRIEIESIIVKSHHPIY